MDVSLRPCFPHDVNQLHDLAMQSYREHYLYLWTTLVYAQWYMDRSFSIDSLKKQLLDPGSSFFMVDDGPVACGFIKINWDNQILNYKNSMELERIYLLRQYSGKGIGTAVMQQVVQMAKDKGRSLLWLKSMDSSPSVRFYQHCGFRKTGIERLTFEGLHDRFRNMWIMERPV